VQVADGEGDSPVGITFNGVIVGDLTPCGGDLTLAEDPMSFVGVTAGEDMARCLDIAAELSFRMSGSMIWSRA
jgi:hypothetical protein